MCGTVSKPVNHTEKKCFFTLHNTVQNLLLHYSQSYLVKRNDAFVSVSKLFLEVMPRKVMGSISELMILKIVSGLRKSRFVTALNFIVAKKYQLISLGVSIMKTKEKCSVSNESGSLMRFW